LPREKIDLRKRLDTLNEGMTYIFFEAPHRIEESLQVMSEKWPEGRFALCRELTKKYESVYRFCGADWGKVRESEGFVLKGEFVGVLYLPPSEKGKRSVDLEECRKIALKMLEEGGGGKKKDLAKLLGEVLGREAKEIYQAISCKSSHSNLE
jgi:16S rRNA (cytidine1402-2'-O)-methyltransferase